jgi:hypothetical protein
MNKLIPIRNPRRFGVLTNITSEDVPVWAWKCVICFKVAQCMCVNVTLCEKHAKEYDFGYGKTLQDMKREQ